MDRIAPDIPRQRLLVEGYFTKPVDESRIRAFFSTITEELGLKPYGEPIIFSPEGMGREENQGYDAFIPLIDSGISLYVWTGKRFCSCVMYTCKAFDAEKAERVMREFFGMTEVARKDF